MLLSIAAIIGGFLVTAILVGGSTALASAALGVQQQPESGETVPITYLAANLFLGLVSAVVGGYVCGWIAPSNPVVHAAILAGLFGVLSLATAVTTGAAPGQPIWYPWVIGVIGISGVVIGGVVRLLLTSPPSA
jgi:hypothetical protein